VFRGEIKSIEQKKYAGDVGKTEGILSFSTVLGVMEEEEDVQKIPSSASIV
jgi:hypothetical protein